MKRGASPGWWHRLGFDGLSRQFWLRTHVTDVVFLETSVQFSSVSGYIESCKRLGRSSPGSGSVFTVCSRDNRGRKSHQRSFGFWAAIIVIGGILYPSSIAQDRRIKQCRLSLRERTRPFAERKATMRQLLMRRSSGNKAAVPRTKAAMNRRSPYDFSPPFQICAPRSQTS